MFRQSTVRNLVVLLLLALVLQQTLLALISILLLLTGGVAWLWNRWSLRQVSYTREWSQPRAFPGDEVELRLTIVNRKPLAVTSFVVRDRIPGGLLFDSPDIRKDRDERQMLERSTGLRWYERVTWRYAMRCEQRGEYRFGPAELEGGDPFGFFRNTTEVAQTGSLLVYPRLLPLDELGLPPRHPLGDLRARQIIRDPLRTVGVRNYVPQDPQKDIHWTATARTGTLQTRIYETTTALELALFLDLDSFEEYWHGIDPEQVERLISAAATLAKVGLEGGYAVGLYVNGSPAQFEHLVNLPPGRSPAQLELIMETLARLTPYSVTPMARLLRVAAADLPFGTTVLLISCIAPQTTQAALARLRERGRVVSWLYLGEDAPPSLAGVSVWHAPMQQDWRAQTTTAWAPPRKD